MKNQPLKVSIEGDELVIRIGLETLEIATENCPEFFDDEKRPYPPYLKVEDSYVWALEIVSQLEKEQEDGTTPVHLLLDQAMFDAWEDGRFGLKE